MTSVEIARKMETEAVEFYREAAAKAQNPVGKEMFLSIAKDEAGHLGMLRDIIEGCALKITEAQPMKQVKTIFEEMKGQMMARVPATATEVDALKIAMDMEKEAVAFYKKAAAESRSDGEKCLFNRLVEEEEEHFRIFNNTHSFLTDTGNWFMWDEHSIVEG